MNLIERLQKTLVFDGAMGTMLMAGSGNSWSVPELVNLEKPEKVLAVHKAYVEAGAQVVTTNTLGANKLKLKEHGLAHKVGEINIRAVEIAREAVGKSGCYVAASIGPTGYFTEPTGPMTYAEAYEVYYEQIENLAKAKPDYLLFETFSDLGEVRAGLLAAKEICDIPVICCLTYQGRKTLTGVSPAAAAVILESLGANAVGANCSGGPEELYYAVKETFEHTNLPVIVQPNAGLPMLKAGMVEYPLGPHEFVMDMEPYFSLGIGIIGSCCGSTPEHTKKLVEKLRGHQPVERKKIRGGVLASRENIVNVSSSGLPLIIGERINPTSRKKLANALRKKNYGVIEDEVKAQVGAGAHLIDLNVGTHGIDEVRAMTDLVNVVQKVSGVPVVIDSVNPEVIVKALEAYQGKALINSISGEEKSYSAILPIVKKFGAGVICLTLDENGIPGKAEERLAIADNLVRLCLEHGLKKEDIYIDCLVLTAGSDYTAPAETLKALRTIKETLNVNTILGISNVSHGLPARHKINSSYLAMAIAGGVDLVIINPLEQIMMDSWQASVLLAGRDPNAANYLSLNASGPKSGLQLKKAPDLTGPIVSGPASLEKLTDLVVSGSHSVSETVGQLLGQGEEPLTIINKGLVPGLNLVGDKFERGEYYLPQLMLGAEVVEKAFILLEQELIKGGVPQKKHTVVLGTVKGDIHDIGKNMVAVMLRTHGYNVVDLGKNVPASRFLEAVKDEKAEVVGLSALMTTTMTEMPGTISLLKDAIPGISVITGGAVITPEYAREIGSDGYSRDAVGAVKLVDELIRKGRS